MEILKKITKYSYIQNLYSKNYNNFNNKNFWDETLKILNIKYNAQGIQNIPSSGPTILVANHPFGILDGLILSSIVSNIRKDYKILINNELTKIDHIKEYLYPLKFSTNKKDGDLSAIIVDNLPFWVNIHQTPNKDIRLMNDFEKKIQQMAMITAEEDVRTI